MANAEGFISPVTIIVYVLFKIIFRTLRIILGFNDIYKGISIIEFNLTSFNTVCLFLMWSGRLPLMKMLDVQLNELKPFF